MVGVTAGRLRAGGATLLAIAAAAVFLWLWRHEEFIDFHVYHLGGLTVLDGGPLYDVFYRTQHGTPLLFTYTPFAAVLMTPLALVPFRVALVVWTVCSIVAWGLALWLSSPKLRRPAVYVVVLVASLWWFMPLVRDLKLGQINSYLVFAILLDLTTLRLGRGRGLLTGIAAGIKLTPLVFLPFLLLTRQFRAAATMAGGFVLTVVIGFAVLPGPSKAYWTGLAWASDRIGVTSYVSNQSLEGAFSRIGFTGAALFGVWLVVAGLAGLACLLLAWAQHERGARALAVGTMALAALFCSPISWSHHWIWILPIVVIALETKGWRQPVPYVVAALFFWSPIWDVPRRHGRELHWTLGQHLAGESYLIGGLILFCWMGWLEWKWRDPGTRATSA